jgi:hypothetical protein
LLVLGPRSPDRVVGGTLHPSRSLWDEHVADLFSRGTALLSQSGGVPAWTVSLPGPFNGVCDLPGGTAVAIPVISAGGAIPVRPVTATSCVVSTLAVGISNAPAGILTASAAGADAPLFGALVGKGEFPAAQARLCRPAAAVS